MIETISVSGENDTTQLNYQARINVSSVELLTKLYDSAFEKAKSPLESS